jgi:hypothetical protein
MAIPFPVPELLTYYYIRLQALHLSTCVIVVMLRMLFGSLTTWNLVKDRECTCLIYLLYLLHILYPVSFPCAFHLGYKRRRLKVQWAKQSEADRKQDTKPTTTLFVVNFDVQRVRERDLDRFFEHYGPITRIEIRRNYAFVQVGNDTTVN